MNGIYDFEQYKAPYLDMEMLTERTEQKRRRSVIICSGIIVMMMAAIVVLLLIKALKTDFALFVISTAFVGVYVVAGMVIMLKLVKKGEKSCHL